MITLHSATETDFQNNGLAVLNNVCKSAVIKQKLNGEYILELELLKDRSEKYRLLTEFCIVQAWGQLFRLYTQDNIQNNMITVKAVLHHITTDLGLDCHDDLRVVNVDCETALNKCILDKRFIVDTDIDASIKNTAYFVEESPLEAIHKKIIPRWGGYFYRDNFNVGIYKDSGAMTDTVIAFRKNIKGFTQKIDYSAVVTRLFPKGKDGIKIASVNGGSNWLESPRKGNYFKTISKVVHYEDADSPKELKEIALKQWGKIDIPQIEFTIDLVDLMQVEEYKRFNQPLTGLSIGDMVTVKHEAFDVNIIARVVELHTDALSEKTIKIVLGDYFNNYIESTTKVIKKEVQEGIGKELVHVNEKITTVDKTAKASVKAVKQEVIEVKTETEQKIQEVQSTVSQSIETVKTDVDIAKDRLNQVDQQLSEVSGLRAELADVHRKIISQSTSIEQTNSHITNTATEVSEINGKVETAVTQTELTAEAFKVLAGKYYNGELKGKAYQFTNTGFFIGAGNGATAQHTESFSKWTHSDGSYTKIGNKGLERYSNDWNNGKTYQYYTYRGSVGGVTSGSTVRVHFPAEFRGKDYEISWWAGNIQPQDNKDLIFSANAELVQQNKAEGWADFKASLMVRNPSKESAPAWRGKLNILYMGFL